jgi:hypothetical protein
MTRLIRIGLIAAALLSGSAIAPVQAQSPFSIFEQLFRPRWQPEPQRDRDPAPRRAPREEAPDGTVYNSSAEADADAKRAAKPQEYVIVIGDTLAEQLAQGLAEAFLAERAEVAIVKKVRASSGLVRIDFHNWIAEAASIVANERATAFVVMLGANDRQALRDETGAHEIRSERWREIYIQRVDELIAKLKEKNVPVLIVGMPAMRLQRLSDDMTYINEILRERATKAGVRYVDVWDGFVDEKGQFMSSGPALDGQTRRLRLGDGVHMTRFGSRKLAHYAELDLIRLFDARARGPLLPFGVQIPTLPGVKPIAGPVLPLTSPMSPARTLVGATEKRDALPEAIDPDAAKTLVDGVPARPVAGRADDFAWPRRGPVAETTGTVPAATPTPPAQTR